MKDLLVGVEYPEVVSNVKAAVDKLENDSCNYVCARMLSEGEVNRCVTTGDTVSLRNFWHDTTITSGEWSNGVIGILPKVEQLESTELVLVERATKLIHQQLDYFQHLSIHAAMFEIDGSSHNLAQIVNARIARQYHHFSFWVKVSLGSSGSALMDNWNDPPFWHWYNQFRKICGDDRRLKVVVKLQADLPDDSVEIDRWLGENVVAVCVPIDIFQTNAKGFPVLSKPHQEVIKKFFAVGVQIVLEISGNNEAAGSLLRYRQYLSNVFKNYLEEAANCSNPYRKYSSGWENYLQAPLQPLMDNLESQTYQVFEQDPVKYNLYFDAICEALNSRYELEKVKLARNEREEKDITLVVACCGAGRGPLVTATRKASSQMKISVKIYALEKNRNAHVRLSRLNKEMWNNEVTIVCADMRYWNAPEKADVIVSELLGSFGDNELSPECLDGAQRFLKESGIIIPQKYTSFVAPVMSLTLFKEVARYAEADGSNSSKHFETPYVVYMTKKFDIAKPKELFTFIHPNPRILSNENVKNNDRYAKLEFEIWQDCECHGFAGYFDSILYGNTDTKTERNVRMSILPETHSHDLSSWFPMFLPLKCAVSLKKGDKLTVAFWRKSTSMKVWYEWTVLTPQVLPIHNTNGKSSNIGLDLHESE